MNTELDNRTVLTKVVSGMSNMELQQLLAYAAGYEAGIISRISTPGDEYPRDSPKQTA